MVAKNKLSVTDTFIKNVVNKPQVFFDNNPALVEQSIALTKHLYDTGKESDWRLFIADLASFTRFSTSCLIFIAKQHEVETFSPFTELLTEGFDHDQIWEELTTQNEPFLSYCQASLQQFTKQWDTLDHDGSDMGASSDQNDEMDAMDADSDELMPSDDEIDQSDDALDAMDDDHDMDEDDEELDAEDIEQEENEDEESDDLDEPAAPTKVSEVDDDFFNLEEFNKWTEEQEDLDMQSDREDDDDEIDFDNDLDDEEGDEDDELMRAADLKFDDFFAPPRKRGGRKQEAEEDEEQDDHVEQDEENDDDDDAPAQPRSLFDDDEPQLDAQGQVKSKFQLQQERIQAQIDQYEQENVEGRHWTLRGEATAKARPVNSLLEEDLEFDHSVKPVPVITQEVTTALEDIIKERIKDNNFDDVERKQDPTLRPFLPSKRVELQDSASKKSLAELYEDEYAKISTGSTANEKDDALAKEHEEITSLFQTLCHKLDALSNFHFTPKQAQPELTVVSNAASISMEEVIPVNVSDATLLAPEEVYDKPAADVKDRSEMDQDERKRARKAKKMQKKKDRAIKEKERQLLQPKVAERHEKTKAVKELMSQKNVTMIGKDGKQIKKDKKITSASLF
ncbi:U3 small nucleolar ribonucleoprotein complex, subunit Mpp10 [Gongronella butleri]|nr:U3 small nucleolar ribonucleoprotein complex, subunit Mpp10 [Gongronella butleri]